MKKSLHFLVIMICLMVGGSVFASPRGDAECIGNGVPKPPAQCASGCTCDFHDFSESGNPGDGYYQWLCSSSLGGVAYQQCLDNAGSTSPGTSGTPGSTSGTATEADKKGLTPPKNRSVNYPTNVSNSTPILKFTAENELLHPYVPPKCPNDPSSIPNSYSTLSDTNDMSPIAPDINQTMPTKIDATEFSGTARNTDKPADQCTVTSVVNQNSDGEVLSTIQAVCPDGYAQVGTYNDSNSMIPEVYYNFQTKEEYPTTVKRYDELIASGYKCNDDAYAGPKWDREITSACMNVPASVPYQGTVTFNLPINVPYAVVAGQSLAGTGSSDTFPSTGVIKFRNIIQPGWGALERKPQAHEGGGENDGYASTCYVAGGTCSDDLDGCDPSCEKNFGAASTSITCTNGIVFAFKAHYTYRYQLCKLEPGFVKTGRTVSGTIICSRIKADYKKVN